MLLTISTTHRPATDLGFLLHKHPDRVQEFSTSFGKATVFYPEADENRCTAALLLEVDPVALTKRKDTTDFSLGQFVNDRSYAASSLFAVAVGKIFATARSGRARDHQELADAALPLEIEIPALPCRGGAVVAERLFGPLGWTVEATPIPLDPEFDWGASRYVHLKLSGTMRLADALNQVYVLLPALDESKHYWQADDEVDKLIRSGGSWLAGHPERDFIARRYLSRTGLTRTALRRLDELDGLDDDAEETAEEEVTEESITEAEQAERPLPLNEQRLRAVTTMLEESGAKSVIDLGCGSGKLLARLARKSVFTKVTGSDVSMVDLKIAERRLRLDTAGALSDRQRDRLSVFQGALTYSDDRFAGYDAAVLMEVIEHIDPSRLPAVERVVFSEAKPSLVVVTTPNAEYNVNYPELSGMRHPDHRFEWTRAEFEQWARGVAERAGYSVEFSGIGNEGPIDATVGLPTQVGVFTRDQ